MMFRICPGGTREISRGWSVSAIPGTRKTNPPVRRLLRLSPRWGWFDLTSVSGGSRYRFTPG